MPIGREDHQERKENRIDRYRGRAAKATIEADQQHRKAENMGSAIPFGQPILVGHHSEKRHRADIKKIETAHRRSAEAQDKAAYYEDKAETAESNRAISGDDPEAVKKYQDKLIKLEAAQERMRAVNKAWKKGKDALHALGFTDEDIEKTKHDVEKQWDKKPFPTWALSNNSAEIRRVKEKLESLKQLDGMAAELVTFPGGEMRINVDNNRVQFIFDDIPAEEIRKRLKSYGFKWARSEGAWQRQRTANAINVARHLVSEFSKEEAK